MPIWNRYAARQYADNQRATHIEHRANPLPFAKQRDTCVYSISQFTARLRSDWYAQSRFREGLKKGQRRVREGLESVREKLEKA